jgi:transposase-like protein
MLERLNQELERRMRPIRIFPSRVSLLRMAATICMEQAEDWDNGRHYIKIEDKTALTNINQQHNISLPFLQSI